MDFHPLASGRDYKGLGCSSPVQCDDMNPVSKRLKNKELRRAGQVNRNNRQRLGNPAKMAVIAPT
jgi:hypothetical protein